MLHADADRLRADMEALARFGANELGGIDRASYSAADAQARAWLAQRCADAALDVREDAIGNLFVRLGDGGAAEAPVWTGSHLDAVPNGGRFDGAAGVVAAVEALRRLREEHVVLARPVEAVVWVDEEGSYHGLLGSTAVADGLDEPDLDRIVGRDGRTLRQALADSGRDPARVGDVRQPRGAANAYVELHIEQGARLEASGNTIGVVTTIVGLAHGQVTFRGQADHAGTTPMDRRRDALRGAAAFLDGLWRLPGELGRQDAVVTCGAVNVAPGADNIVPAGATCRLDFRHPDGDVVGELETGITRLAERCAADHELSVEYRRDHLAEPVAMDPGLQRRIAAAAEALGYGHQPLSSGAGHDAQKIAAIAPAAMLFVPSVAGRSHSPAERTEWDDLARGADVLLNVVAGLAGG